MYARLSLVPTKPDTWDQALGIWREQLLPLIRQQQGFKGVIVMGDRAANKGATITLWETEADAQASMQSENFRKAMAALAPVITGQPEMQHYEVAIQEFV
jgi:heme-degrading monooxygenase HmoA